jgi:catechol 2,3-dioxygenase-like lactoylglutathione lyase family enzyme
LRPMVRVGDMAASIKFYEKLGAEIIHGGPDSAWVLLQLGTVQIGLIRRPPGQPAGEDPVELHFGAGVPLAQLAQRLGRAEITTDREFGERLRVRTPEGLTLTITQREPE